MSVSNFPKIPPVTRVSIDSGLTVSMVRYALGRATYVVAWTIRELRSVWPDLPERDRFNIIRNISEQLHEKGEKGLTVGMRMDDDEWRAFLHEVTGDESYSAEQGGSGDLTAVELARTALEQYGRVAATGLGTSPTEDLLAQALTAVVAGRNQESEC